MTLTDIVLVQLSNDDELKGLMSAEDYVKSLSQA